MTAPLRELPPVHRFTTDPLVARYDALVGHGTVRAFVQSLLDQTRAAARQGVAPPNFDELRTALLERLSVAQCAGLVQIINGTGVILHTNFGRAPLAPQALAAAEKLGAGYSNLEYDLVEGQRGSRYERVSSQLRELTGAQAALVVNNCAAAVLLVLDTFARGREVVVSRGQLIEIGGGFRLPDVLAKSGARLVEIGTTNKTYALDYRNAWSEQTALFMRTHPSNYRIDGFVAEVDSQTLAGLARELGVISFEDLGSGALVGLECFGLPHEPTVAEEIAAGVDLVAFSGDKLLGGPQCGVIAGREELIDMMRRNPLLRALRVDKLTLAALSATLALYLEPDRITEIPLYRMLAACVEDLRARAEVICSAVASRNAEIDVATCDCDSTTGGGTLPLARLGSAGIAVSARDRSVDALAAVLRRHEPPLIGRLEDKGLVIDLRTVAASEDPIVIEALGGVRTTA